MKYLRFKWFYDFYHCFLLLGNILQDHCTYKCFTVEKSVHSFYEEVKPLNGFWKLVTVKLQLPYCKRKRFLAWHFVVAELKRYEFKHFYYELKKEYVLKNLIYFATSLSLIKKLGGIIYQVYSTMITFFRWAKSFHPKKNYGYFCSLHFF